MGEAKQRARRISELADELGCGLKVIRQAIRRGELDAVQLGPGANSPYYVTDEDVQAWLESRRASER